MNITLPVAASDAPIAHAPAIIAASHHLLGHLERGERVDATVLRSAMEATFGASDSSGAWNWKAAYDACEATTVLFLRKYGKALFRKAGSPAARLSALAKTATLLPTHTRRSEEAQTFQQFSTPIPLGLAAATAAAITPADRVLEPSAGTGLLAIFAEIAGGSLMLNELADMRAGLLSSLFPAISVTRFDAAQIDDHLDPSMVPSVVLMNPPFSVMANVEGRVADAAFRHVASALARLTPGGRLVTITGASFAPDHPTWSSAFARLQEHGRIVFSAAIHGSVYAKHGTTIDTRLTVIDKLPAGDPTAFPASPGIAPDVATLMSWLDEHLPARLPIDSSVAVPVVAASMPRSVRGYLNRAARSAPAALIAEPEGLPLAYETIDWRAGEAGRLSDAIYEEYGLQAIRISGSQAHPTQLVQSAAMASVAPPKPSYRPRLPANVHELLSDAQLETVIYAGEAHSDYLAGSWRIDDTFDVVTAARDDAKDAVRFRRGFMIGDGTGVGKGRQSAAVILDNWCQGRRKAATAKRELDQETEKAFKAATAAAKDAETARARIDRELQAAKKKLESFAQSIGTAAELERLAGEVARLSPIAFDLAQRLAYAEAEATELERLATADERAVRDLRENIVATQFFNGLQPVCCPRCETRVSSERLKRESADLSCSLCAEEIPINEMEGASDGLDAIEQRFAAAKTAAGRSRANAKALDEQSRASSAELEKARLALTNAATSATFEQRREAELEVARLEGALKERQAPATPVTVSPDVALVSAAHAEAEKAYIAGRGDILERLDTEILALGQRLGVQMLEKVKLNTNASLLLTKGGEPTSFSKVTAGERLRLRIATAVALLRVGQERGLGRHPGLLIVDSPAAEEVSPDDLTAVLSELQAIAHETDGLQIIIGSANASAIVDQLGEQWCRSAKGNDYLW